MKKALAHLQAADPQMAQVIDAVGPYRITYSEPCFGSLVRSIVYQQLSGKVASVIHGRFVALTGEPVRPARILKLTPEQMRAAGLSAQKASYIRDLAEKARKVGFARLPELSDEEVIQRLTAVKGVGVWTAHMFLIFSLRRPDILPVGDLGVRMAIRNVYGLPDLPSPQQMEAIAEPWHPWCSVASWYLWRSLELPSKTAV